MVSRRSDGRRPPSRRIAAALAVLMLVAALPSGPGGAAADGCGKSEDYTATWEIQGTGHTSPMEGETVDDVRGIVTANLQEGTGGPDPPEGFFLQAHEPDCDPGTSDGLFVYTGFSPADVQVGSLVSVDDARVAEFDGPGGSWERTLTELDCAGDCRISTLETDRGQPQPVEYDPPGAPLNPPTYKEAREGMLVHVTIDGTLVSPNDGFHAFAMVRGDDRPRLHENSSRAGQRITVDAGAVDAGECGRDGLGRLSTFDVYHHDPPDSLVYGPLTYGFGAYRVQQDDTHCLDLRAGDDSSWDAHDNPPPTGRGTNLTVATLNAWNLFDDVDAPSKADPVPTTEAYHHEADKLARLVCHGNGLDTPDVLALQEVENEAVLDRLAADVDEGCGAEYTTHTRQAPDDRSIQNGYLVRTDRATVVGVQPRQGCSSTDRGVDYETAQPGIDCPSDEPHFLHLRPPLELELAVERGGVTHTVVLLANHFKSRLDSPNCERDECQDWRIDEAEHVAQLAREHLYEDPDAGVIALGDLNDGVESGALARLEPPDGPLSNAMRDLEGPPADEQGSIQRYTSLFNGLSQTLDHVLVGPALDGLDRTTSVRHVNADRPPERAADDTMSRSSDHDPVLVSLELGGDGRGTAASSGCPPAVCPVVGLSETGVR